MNKLQEKINPKKYKHQIEKLYGTLKYMILNDVDLNHVIEVFKDPRTHKITSMYVKAKTNVDDRIKWKNGKESKIIGILSCEEIIECNDDDTYSRTFFSYHFEAMSESDVCTFRIDFKPKQLTPLHAHDYMKKDAKEHLSYPEDTKLELTKIDFCTIMLIVSYYVKNREKYPLHYGEEYNPLINKKRRRYDEYREN